MFLNDISYFGYQNTVLFGRDGTKVLILLPIRKRKEEKV